MGQVNNFGEARRNEAAFQRLGFVASGGTLHIITGAILKIAVEGLGRSGHDCSRIGGIACIGALLDPHLPFGGEAAFPSNGG